MILALTASALMLGLAGGPHCVAMCGALQSAAARHRAGSSAGRALIVLQIGRLAGYSAAGAAVAASAGAIANLGVLSPVLRPVWAILQVAAFALGVALLWRGKVPAWLSALGRERVREATASQVRFMDRLPASARAAGIGLCWAAMPCGLLQSALIVASLAPDAVGGAGVMAVFAAGTTGSLWLASSAWGRLHRSGVRWARSTLPVRLAGALLAVASGVALARGLGSAVGQALCT